jgi:hypothetical protein
MNKTMKALMAAAFAVMTSGTAMAGHICAYANDNNLSGPNTAEGYMIGPGTATVHVGPYSTNGSGNYGGFAAGGLGAARVKEGDLYVSDALSDNITHFTINKTDCTLTLDTTLYPSGDTMPAADSLVITPDGSMMLVASTGDNHIYSHTIAGNGSLGAAFKEASTPVTPTDIEVSSNGRTLVVSYAYAQQVCAYPISHGHLGKPNCQSTVGFPSGISIDSANGCVYAAEANYTASEIAAFTLTKGVLGIPTDYNSFGPGVNSSAILVNWDNKDIYVTNPYSAQLTVGSIAAGCTLAYKAIVSDGAAGADNPAQIAQAKITHGYVVTGDINDLQAPIMGIFQAHVNGTLTPIGSGRFQMLHDGAPLTVVVVDAGSSAR